ncbi:MAG: hypothetical protein QW279_06725 [Candidatus Jordarchaeaceae archaeon]
MPIDRRDLLFLSTIPFQLSGEEQLNPIRWCFYLSFDWGIHKELTPSIAQKILTLALEEKILEKQNETLTLKERCVTTPLYKFDKKIDPKELINVKPYPLKTKIEYNEVELQIQKSVMKKEKEKEPLAGHFQKSKKPIPQEEVKEEKKKEEPKDSKEELKEEKTKQKTKSTKKQKSKDEKPELTLDHFTQNPK